MTNRLAILAAAFALATGPAGAQPVVGMTLEKIVTLSRHGVRSPTKAPADLAKFASSPWPQWPVEPGVLTEHGERDVRLMGRWLRADYAGRGLWPAKGCLKAGTVYEWADGKSARTVRSGQAMLDGALPGCGLQVAHGPTDREDPTFSASSAGACPMDAEEAKKAIFERAGGDLNRLGARYDAAEAALQAIVRPGAPGRSEPNGLKDGGEEGAHLTGPLPDGATLSENLFLEYAQGMPADQVGWGRAGSGAVIASVMPLHTLSGNLTRANPYVARHNGALAMRAILAALDGKPGLPGQGGRGTIWTAIAGHDTNLANVAGILGVDWTLTGQPDETPPDATLVFEVWKGQGGQRAVRLALIYQTLQQLRTEAPLDAAHPPGRVDLAIPGCSDGPGASCRLRTFQALIAPRLPPECVARF